MGGILGALDTASRALQVTQSGLSVTSHNIANVDTPGYTRQRQVLRAGLAIPNEAGHIGTGVEQFTIDRITDEFVQRRLVQQHAANAELQERSSVLSQIETIFNEQGAEGLSSQISALYDAFGKLSASTSPRQPVERAELLAAGQSLVDRIHRLDSDLRNLQDFADRSIGGLVPQINAITQRIAELNQEIVALDVRAPANDLRDQRDQLMTELAGMLEISSFEDTKGSVTILFEGGLPLVDGIRANQLVTSADVANPFNPTYSRVAFDDGANTFDVTVSLQGGRLGGLLQARDGDVAGAIRDLDSLAYTLIDAVNTQHQAGFGLVDGSPHSFFIDTLPGVDDAASLIALHSDVVTDPGHIAAADVPPPGNEGNNVNALALANLRTALGPNYLAGDLAGAPSGLATSVLEKASGIVADQGLAARVTEQARLQSEAVLSEVQNQRDAIAGVSLDEEVTDLIRLQASFQANSRVVVAVNAMLEDLVGIL